MPNKKGTYPSKNWDLDASFRWHVKFGYCFVIIFLAMTFVASTTFADDKNLEEILDENTPLPAGYYSPDFCDFEITFPEKPVTSRRCPEGTGKCYQISGFTYVYDMQTTVDVTAQCTKSTPKNYTQYNDAVIKAVLNGMVRRANIDQFDVNVRTMEEEKIRQGSLLGTGNYNNQEKIYNAQIWVSENSILTIEGKMIGKNNPQADEAFADILASIRVKAKANP